VATVLIVDDSRLNVEVLSHMLAREYRTLRACDGHQALELAAAHRPDIILLDIVMPGLDGYQVCSILKSDARTRDVPVIFVTGMDDEDSAKRGLAAGADGFLTKPICPTMVLNQVAVHLELRRAKELLATLCGGSAPSGPRGAG
jgi:CheY-like chemotaxis protein